MRWLSEDVEQLVTLCQASPASSVQCLVIGSGYGGAVAAARFAESGQSVWLLERGKEYLAGDFPADLGQAPEHVRSESLRRDGVRVSGYEQALFDFRLGQDCAALLGNGLGGGSLINAAVALRADERVFQQDGWPASLRDAATWRQHYERAEEGLGIQHGAAQRAATRCVPQQTLKYQRLGELAAAARQAAGQDLSVTLEDVPLAIQFGAYRPPVPVPLQACLGCGNCVSGCNHHAKLSLDKTYLPRARRAGACLFTGVSALWIEHRPDETAHPGRPWVAWCVRSSERALWAETASADTDKARELYLFQVRAAQVVLAAGALGSTEILLRSRQQAGLSLSSRLGQRISANGDDLSAAYDLPRETGGIGVEEGEPTQAPDPARAPVGPTISGVIRFHHHHDVRQSTVTEDGGIPGLLRPIAREGFATFGVLPQILGCGFRHGEAADPLAVQPTAVERSLILLGMGHDGANGQAGFEAGQDRLAWRWTSLQGDHAPQLHRDRLQAIHQVGGLPLPNPFFNPLPAALSTLLGPEAGLRPGWVTVHPLGGCGMADSVSQGVVNDRCQVYRADGGVHPGLYVMDGSVMPGSLGCNPFLTITALAERACTLALQAGTPARDTTGACASGLPPYPREHLEPAPPCQPGHAHLLPQPGAKGSFLNEVLRGELAWDAAALRVAAPQLATALGLDGGTPATGHPSALFLEMDIDDWGRLWQDPQHRTPVRPGDSAPILDERAFTRSRLVIDRPGQPSLHWPVSGGTVQVFHPKQASVCLRIRRLPRTILTYLLGRVMPESSASLPSIRSLIAGLRVVWHATATRGFTYELTLAAAGTVLRLRGDKLVDPAASWSALWQALRHKLHTCRYTVVERPSAWDQLTRVQVQLRLDGQAAVLARGQLAMDIPEMVRRIAPQLKDGPNVVQALAAFASYPALIARHLLISRPLDFGAPDYRAGLPETDWAADPAGPDRLRHEDFPCLKLASGRHVAPEPPLFLNVPLHAAAPAGEQIRVALVRYKQPAVRVQTIDDQRRYRAILLMNGFAQNTLPFVAPELGSGNLATQLYEQGWDVWLYEYRVSPMLRASARFSSMDDIAAVEIPRVVQEVIDILDRETQASPGSSQVFMFSHCVGSAALAMSLLGGHLHQRPSGIGLLAGVLFSQFQPFVIGSTTAQMRLQVAALLVAGLGIDYVQFSAGSVQADPMHALFDRLFASFHYDPAERCPHEADLGRHQPDTTSCKRMAGLLSRLFRHDQLHLETHEKLDRYFGRTNLGVFLHGAKCVESERLLNAHGQNVYLTETNIRKYLDMPLMLLHGKDNVLFDPASFCESRRQLTRAFSPERRAARVDRFFLVPKHAHFDCTIGKNAPRVIFPRVLDFFDRACTAPVLSPGKSERLRARLPLTGPLIGWTRRVGNTVLMRVWIEVDSTQADEPVAAMTVLSVNGQRRVQCWEVLSRALETDLPQPNPPPPPHGLRHAVADLQWPADASGTVSVCMVSLHRYGDGQPVPPADPAWSGPADWGVPMTLAEATVSAGRTPSRWDRRRVPPEQPSPRRARTARAAPALPALAPAAPDVVQPLPPALDLDDALTLLRPLARLVADARATALRARPGTLSRQSRTLRAMGEAWVRVRETTWRGGARGDSRFLAATCRHPGLSELESWRRDTQLFALAQRQQEQPASLMWMLGDQIYADASGGLADSPSPVERFLPRYRQAFNSPGFRALARQLPLHMVLDDHEIADNWSLEWQEANPAQRRLAANAKTAFEVFQQAHGPGDPAVPGVRDAGFDWQDVAFYRLDTRSHRRRAPRREMLSDPQWLALQAWLLAQQARGDQPKFIASGSVLAPGLAACAGDAHTPPPRQGDTWQACPADRQRLLQFIAHHRIRNVVFLSGDYHCAAVATLEFSGSDLRAHALVCPPLHAPMPFANTRPEDILPGETVDLDSAGSVHITAQAFPGQGWLECTPRQTASGGWLLDLLIQRTPLGQTQAHQDRIQLWL